MVTPSSCGSALYLKLLPYDGVKAHFRPCLPSPLEDSEQLPPILEEQACSPEPHFSISPHNKQTWLPYPSQNTCHQLIHHCLHSYIKLSSSLRESCVPCRVGRCFFVWFNLPFSSKPTPELVTSHSLHVVDISVVAAAPIGWLCSAFPDPSWMWTVQSTCLLGA